MLIIAHKRLPVPSRTVQWHMDLFTYLLPIAWNENVKSVCSQKGMATEGSLLYAVSATAEENLLPSTQLITVHLETVRGIYATA